MLFLSLSLSLSFSLTHTHTYTEMELSAGECENLSVISFLTGEIARLAVAHSLPTCLPVRSSIVHGRRRRSGCRYIKRDYDSEKLRCRLALTTGECLLWDVNVKVTATRRRRARR